jgi:hypothetical protein
MELERSDDEFETDEPIELTSDFLPADSPLPPRPPRSAIKHHHTPPLNSLDESYSFLRPSTSALRPATGMSAKPATAGPADAQALLQAFQSHRG